MGKTFLWILICVVIGYGLLIGIRCIKVNLDYSNLKSEAKELFGPKSNVSYEEVPEKLVEMAEEQEIPLLEQNVDVYVDNWEGVRVVSFNYVDTVSILNYKNLLFHFSFADTVHYRPRK
jgi:hypothetical protein